MSSARPVVTLREILRPNLFRSGWKVVHLCLRVAPVPSAILAVLLLLGAFMTVGFIIATAALIGQIPQAMRDGLQESPWTRMGLALGSAAVFFTVQQISAPFRDAIAQSVGRKLDAHLRDRVMAATLAPAGIGHLEDPELLDKVAAAESIAGGVKPGMAVVGLTANLAARLDAFAAAALAASFRWWAALALIGGALLARTALLRETTRWTTVLAGQARGLRRSDYFRDLAISPAAAKETRLFGLSDWLTDRFSQHWMGAMSKLWQTRKEGRHPWPWFLPLAAATFATFYALGLEGLRGEIGLVTIALVAQAAILAGVVAVTDNDLYLQYGAAAILPVEQLEAAIDPAEAARTRLEAAGLPRSQIRFEGVSFRYPHQDRDVLKGIDLVIPASRSLAIVGPNGAGKTTIIKLLARLYDPQSGRITVDGIDLAEIRPDSWWSRMATIFQDFVRYELSASENVSLPGSVDRHDTERFQIAARKAGADKFVEKLPQGWNTVLSKSYTGGSDISGGEWQRIALARALFAVESGATVLVLDEPTANLDVRAEAEIFERFLELTKGLTTVLVSHRFSTVRRADTICVIDEGRVKEQGSHDDLMALGGTYARMFNLQASRFLEPEETLDA